ncbi:hypothetical protein [Chelatococcus sp. GW1]|uniref:hypothetical protein n=1 Tax=Chelatococcus sp. GW1 TaxID=1211115 RepID=UPI000379A064|nr:hypothetical protein [Chelatococcus sp. GW1]
MPQQMSFNPLLSTTRAAIDRHNEWMEKHPRPQRRSKSAPRSSTGDQRTGVALIGMVVLAQLSETSAAISGGGRGLDGRGGHAGEPGPPRPSDGAPAGKAPGASRGFNETALAPGAAGLSTSRNAAAMSAASTSPIGSLRAREAPPPTASSGPAGGRAVTRSQSRPARTVRAPRAAAAEPVRAGVQFKSFAEIRNEILSAMPLDRRVKFELPFNGKIAGGRALLLEKAAKKLFHKQFDEYIRTKVPAISSVLAQRYAGAAGITDAHMNHIPNSIWQINKISQYHFGPLMLHRNVDLTRHMNMPAYIVDAPNGKFLFVSPDGKPSIVGGQLAWRQSNRALLRLLAVKPGDFHLGRSYLRRDVEARANTQRQAIRQLVEEKITGAIVRHIRELEQKSEPSEWKAKLEVVEEILEGAALAATLLAAPVLMPEGLAADAVIEAAEAMEAEGALAEGAGASAIASEVDMAEAGAPEIIGGDAAQVPEEAGELTETETLLRCRRGNGCAKTSAVAAPDPAHILNGAYADVAARHGLTTEAVSNIIDSEAAETIPKFLYRGQSGSTIRCSATVAKGDLDDYLVALLKHT